MAVNQDYSTKIERLYIDTRSLLPRNTSNRKADKPPLPLLSTLPQDIQDGVKRFYRVEDNFMSLASALLKFTFIHRIAKVPWSDIQISKTPRPHARPYWQPPADWRGDDFEGLEFNVSHQAGVVILAGCRTPGRPERSLGVDQNGMSITPDPTQQVSQELRIGVDIACTKEPRRTQDLSTQAKLEAWVDTFSEMFSARERKDMKESPVPDGSLYAHLASLPPIAQTYEQKGRRFYTYWALKEAYIKMVGEGLLADWLRELEFVNVTSPAPGEKLIGAGIGLRVMFRGKDISDSIHVELEGYEADFLFTMITRGITEPAKSTAGWTELRIEDIVPCAEGRCTCLD